MALKNCLMGKRTCCTDTVHGKLAHSSRRSLVFCVVESLVRCLELLWEPVFWSKFWSLVIDSRQRDPV
jgi:hypothetical protein